MMKNSHRIRGKSQLGDVFEVLLHDRRKVYLQYIGTDALQIKTHVIRVFKNRYSAESNPDIEEIVSDSVEFYAHVISVEFGIQDGTWQRIGNSKNLGDPRDAFFRDPGDSAVKRESGLWGMPEVSKTWYLWRLGDSEKVFVKQLIGKDTEADRGSAMWPAHIIERIETGRYSGFYPSYQ